MRKYLYFWKKCGMLIQLGLSKGKYGIKKKGKLLIMKKKLLAILLCASMVFAVAACGDGKKDDTQGGTETEKEIVPPTLTKLADFSDIDAILVGDYEVTDEVIADGFKSFVSNLGIGVEWTEVTDRDTIQEGDIVKLDYTGYLNGEAFSGGSATDQWIDVKNNCSVDATTAAAGSSFIDGFTDGLLGAKVGTKVSHDVTFPENYGKEELNGQLTTFEFNIKGIYTYKEYTLDGINDEFVVKNFADYSLTTVDELKAYINETLTYAGLLDYIIDNSEFDISDAYVEYRTDLYLDYYNEYFQSYYGVDYETYLSYMGATIEDVLSDWKTSMKEQVKEELVYAALVKENKLEVDEAELKEYILSNLEEDATDEEVEENLVGYYEYMGLGDAEAGKEYALNEAAARELLRDKLGFEAEEVTE